MAKKYIDADKLRAEIEKRMEKHWDNLPDSDSPEDDWTHNELCELGAYKELEHIEDFLNSFQQEQPDNWDEQYREDDLRMRFAFYTYKDEDSILYLSNVFVEETSRNKGFGTKILQSAENVAETIGAITIRLKVKQNFPANDWYRKHGYGYLTFEGEHDWLEKNLEYLKPKQEQPEVDLEKEIIRYQREDMDRDTTVRDVARHFYELARQKYEK